MEVCTVKRNCTFWARTVQIKSTLVAILKRSTLMAFPQNDIEHFVTITRRNILSSYDKLTAVKKRKLAEIEL